MAAYHFKFMKKSDGDDSSQKVYIDQSSSTWLVTECEPWRRPSGGLNAGKHNTLAPPSRSD
jgi:hypothetical protein